MALPGKSCLRTDGMYVQFISKQLVPRIIEPTSACAYNMFRVIEGSIPPIYNLGRELLGNLTLLKFGSLGQHLWCHEDDSTRSESLCKFDIEPVLAELGLANQDMTDVLAVAMHLFRLDGKATAQLPLMHGDCFGPWSLASPSETEGDTHDLGYADSNYANNQLSLSCDEQGNSNIVRLEDYAETSRPTEEANEWKEALAEWLDVREQWKHWMRLVNAPIPEAVDIPLPTISVEAGTKRGNSCNCCEASPDCPFGWQGGPMFRCDEKDLDCCFACSTTQKGAQMIAEHGMVAHPRHAQTLTPLQCAIANNEIVSMRGQVGLDGGGGEPNGIVRIQYRSGLVLLGGVKKWRFHGEMLRIPEATANVAPTTWLLYVKDVVVGQAELIDDNTHDTIQPLCMLWRRGYLGKHNSNNDCMRYMFRQ